MKKTPTELQKEWFETTMESIHLSMTANKIHMICICVQTVLIILIACKILK